VRRFAALALVLAACGPRAVLGGAREPSSARGDEVPGASASATTAPLAGQTLLDTPITIVSAGDGGLAEQPTGVVISRLPAPHRVAAAEAPLPRTVADAFTLVGHRDPREPLAFALAVATSLRPPPDRALPAFADGPEMVAWARELRRYAPVDAAVAPGDLLVFDRAAASAPASLVGVALETDDRGVTTFLYLARGVVRVGRVDPARPRIARDREGRPVNSYIRHTTDYPPKGTRYLAGELLAGSIRLSSSR